MVVTQKNIKCEFEDYRIIGVERRNENRNPNSKER